MAAPSLWNIFDRDDILKRIDKVSENARPAWGAMSVEQMLAHLTESMKMASGDLRPALKKSMLGWPPVRHALIYWLPWPKGTPTAPELLAGSPIAVAEARENLRRLVETFGKKNPDGLFPEHPVFGDLSGKAWGALGYKHIDHHLRQFGA